MTEIHLEFSLPSVEKLVTCQQVHVTSKKHITSLGRHLSPWNSCVFPSGDTLLDSCHLTTTWMCNIRLQAPTLAWKCEISHWFPCGVDRQTIELMHGHTKFHFVITIISLFFFQESKHHLCLRLQDFSMWCFSCHSEVQPSDGSSGSANSETTSSPRPKVHLTSST